MEAKVEEGSGDPSSEQMEANDSNPSLPPHITTGAQNTLVLKTHHNNIAVS
jgi:hypothetical protein